MKTGQASLDATDNLKARIEKFLAAKKSDLEQLLWEDIQKLVSDLRAHQITLEREIEELRRTQKSLSKSQDRLTNFYDLAPVAYFCLDPQGNILDANITGVKLFGTPKDLLLNTPFIRFVVPENHPDFQAHLQGEPDGGISQSRDLLLRPHQGPPFSASLESQAVVDDGGKIVQYHTVVRDITKRKQAEENLRKSEALYRLIVETANEGIWAIDGNYQTTYVNPVMAEMLGYRLEEMLNRPASDFIFPEELSIYEATMDQIRQGLDVTIERRLRRKDGSDFWAIIANRSLFDDQGQFQGSFAMFTDISQHKQADAALRLAAHQWQATFDAISDGICLMDLNCRILGCNQSVATLVKRPVEEILGYHCYEIVHGTSERIPECPLTAMLESRQQEEVILPFKDRWIKVTVDPVLDETGTLLGAVHRMTDITQLKKSEEALKESEAYFRQLFELGADAIFLQDREKIIEVNEQACLCLGYSREELLGLRLTDLEAEISQDQRNQLLESRQKEIHKNTFYGTYRRKDGSTFPVEVRSRDFAAQGRTLRLAAARDITAQREAEKAIRDSEHRFRELFNHMKSGVIVYEVTSEGKKIIIKDLNRAAERIEIKKKRAVLGRDVREVFPGAEAMGMVETILRVWSSGNPEHLPLAHYQDERISGWRENFVYRLPSGEVVAVYDDVTDRVNDIQALRQSRETLRVLLDAMPAAVLLLNPQGIILAANKVVAERFGKSIKEMVGSSIFDHLEPELAASRQARLEEVKRTGQPLVFEDSREGLILDNYIHPIFSGAGALAGFAVLAIDITERKRAEKALAQQARFLQLLIDTIPAPVFYKDAQGLYLGCNQAFQNFYGLTKDQIMGKTVDCLEKPEIVGKYHQMDVELFQNPGVQEYEFTTQRCDGKKREVVITKATFLKTDGTVGGLIGVQTDVSELKQAETQLRALAARLAEVEEMERQHLARELHDEVGQGLTALGLNLTLLKAHMPQEATAPLLNRLADAVTLVEKTGETIRNIMAELRPPVLDDYGLLSALRWYGDEFSQRTGIRVDILGEEAVPRLATPVELALFRIAQEALTNVAKHASASQVELAEEVDNRTVRLVISDNGVGFDRAKLGQPEGRYRWGLMNMSERAVAVGGRCHIESRPGHGTKVVVEVSR